MKKQSSILILILLFFGLISCTQVKETGPLEIKYDRDACSECGMAISDSRFAAQIRGGKDHKHSAYKFDDIGCAMKFARKQAWFKDADTESYVMDYETKEWLNSLTAHYRKTKTSPMGYGYSAHKQSRENSFSYDDVNKAIGE